MAKKPATPTPAPSSPAPAPRKTKRAAFNLSESDFDRLRWEVLASEKTTWQGMLTEAVNLWLAKKGHPPLEDLQ